MVQQRVGLRRGVGRLATDEAPQHVLVRRVRGRHEVQQHRKRDRRRVRRRLAAMDVPGRVFELLFRRLLRIGVEEGEVLVHRFRDDVEIELLRRLRLLPLIQRQAFGGRIGQPLLDRDAIALGLGNLLALLVEKELVDELLRWLGAEDLADLRIDRRVGHVVLAEHLEVDAERRPAHAEIRLPLQLHMSARDRQRRVLAILVDERHSTRLRINRLHRHVENATRRRRDRQEGRIGLAPFRPQRRQHHLHDVIVLLGGAQQHRVEPARLVQRRRRSKFILKAEAVEEGPQPRIHVCAIALMRAEGIRHSRERHLHETVQLFRVRNSVRHLAHAVHVVRHADHPRLAMAAGQRLERAAHHRCAHHFAERADVRQAGWAIARLEHNRRILGAPGLLELLDARLQLAGLFERPGFCSLRDIGEGHGKLLSDRLGVVETRVKHWGLPLSRAVHAQRQASCRYLQSSRDFGSRLAY